MSCVWVFRSIILFLTFKDLKSVHHSFIISTWGRKVLCLFDISFPFLLLHCYFSNFQFLGNVFWCKMWAKTLTCFFAKSQSSYSMPFVEQLILYSVISNPTFVTWYILRGAWVYLWRLCSAAFIWGSSYSKPFFWVGSASLPREVGSENIEN